MQLHIKFTNMFFKVSTCACFSFIISFFNYYNIPVCLIQMTIAVFYYKKITATTKIVAIGASSCAFF